MTLRVLSFRLATTGRSRLVAAIAVAAGVSSCAEAAPGDAMNLCGFQKVFSEDFDTLSVDARDGSKARWTAHTPWDGDFGAAVFSDPQAGFPFTVADGVLTIEARKGEDGKWRSGLLSAVDAQGRGFSTAYGYFEARAKLPAGDGLWPAFWLGTAAKQGDKSPSVEVDVIEHYGRNPRKFHSTVHIWRKDPPGALRPAQTNPTVVPSGSLSNDFRLYGVDVRRETIVFYLDRKEIWRVETPPELDKPLFPLINLALGGGWPIDATPSPSRMEVDYVHVYAPPAGDRPKDCDSTKP